MAAPLQHPTPYQAGKERQGAATTQLSFPSKELFRKLYLKASTYKWVAQTVIGSLFATMWVGVRWSGENDEQEVAESGKRAMRKVLTGQNLS